MQPSRTPPRSIEKDLNDYRSRPLAGFYRRVRLAQRAHDDHGWLDTYYSFSFADYYDPAEPELGCPSRLQRRPDRGGSGFPPHPHRDMEIVTYVLSGELAHRDSMGNQGVVGPGGVQFMSAGTGVRHSEYNNRSRRAAPSRPDVGAARPLGNAAIIRTRWPLRKAIASTAGSTSSAATQQ